MQKIVPFLWFDDQAEEAVNFYTSIFPGGRVGAITKLEGTPGPVDRVITFDFSLAGQDFMALNGGPEFDFTPAISFMVYCQSAQEVDALWRSLIDGGSALMELEQYPFAEKYGWLMDRYGVSWQLILTDTPDRPLRIAPALLFVGEQFGRAEEAMEHYTTIFPDARIDEIARYLPGEGGAEGAIKYATFTLARQEFTAMESDYNHQFGFTSAISFHVNCENQEEVDYYWDRLAEGGAFEQCGWLKDKFGVSWQVVPSVLGQMLNDPDRERTRRVTKAMLKMVKLDIGQLEDAYR